MNWKETMEDLKKKSVVKRPPKNIIDEYKKLYTDVVYDGLARLMGPFGGVCNPDIRPVLDFMKGKIYAGPAITIKWAQRELLTLAEKRLRESGKTREDYQAIMDVAQPGDIIVSDGLGFRYGYWGDVLSSFAKAKGIEAIVIDGYTRDRANNERLKFPIFARGSTPLAEAFCMETVDMNVPVQCGGVEVCPGDLVIADDDGVMVVPQRHIEETLKYALEKREYEERMIADAKNGMSLTESMSNIYFELHQYKNKKQD